MYFWLFFLGKECRALETIDCNIISVSCSSCPKEKDDSTQKQQVQLVSVTQRRNIKEETNHVTSKAESYWYSTNGY